MPPASDSDKRWEKSWNAKFRRIHSPRAALRLLDTLLLPYPSMGGLSEDDIEKLKAHFRDKLSESQ